MIEEGDPAPNFAVPRAGGEAYDDITEFELEEHLGDGPIVLAFYPAAFTGGCTEEMCTFRDSMAEFNSLDASVYGISVDLPFAQNIFIQEHDLNFPMLSDFNQELIESYGIGLDGLFGLKGLAQRSVFVIDEEGTVTYKWVREGDNPDFEELVTEIQREVQ